MTLMWFRCHIPHLTPTQFNGTLILPLDNNIIGLQAINRIVLKNSSCIILGSLASHTPQSEGKGDHAYNELFWRQELVASNQIRDSPPVKRCQAINSNLESDWTRPIPVARTTRCMRYAWSPFPSDCGVWLIYARMMQLLFLIKHAPRVICGYP